MLSRIKNRIKHRLSQNQEFKYNIEQFNAHQGMVFVSGWAFFDASKVDRIYYLNQHKQWRRAKFEVRASQDVANAHNNSNATHARFVLRLVDDLPENTLALQLKFQSGWGPFKQEQICAHLQIHGIERGPYRQFVPNFFRDYVVGNADIKSALEIGSRARSGINNKDTYLPDNIDFTGVDVLDGECVDIVCDAHELSQHVKADHYDLVYSLNVFEHLLMPWKVVLEINKVMKQGGIIMIFTHHSYPLHDLPWDYFRFSDMAWCSLFNKATGFEIIDTQLIDPVSIIPKCIYEGSAGIKDEPAYIHSAVIARKISDTELSWDVDNRSIVEAEYPH